MERTDDLRSRLEKLKQELEQAPPKNEKGQPIVRRRSEESSRLANIAYRIRSEEPEGVRDCLMKVWFDAAKKRIEGWLQQDTANMNANKGGAIGRREQRGHEPTFRSVPLTRRRPKPRAAIRTLIVSP